LILIESPLWLAAAAESAKKAYAQAGVGPDAGKDLGQHLARKVELGSPVGAERTPHGAGAVEKYHDRRSFVGRPRRARDAERGKQSEAQSRCQEA